MKSIKPEEFFRLIAINSGISDLETIKDIYYGMIRTISRELRDKQTIKLPDWGDFNLKIHKARKYKETNNNTFIDLPAKPTVKFVPDYKVKRYFYSLGEEGTMV